MRLPLRQPEAKTAGTGALGVPLADAIAPSRPRRLGAALERASGAPLTILVGLCAAIPVIVASAHALQAGWQPVADRAIIATHAYDVFSSHMPLVGQYSFAGFVTGHLTYSLGPMLYWLLAPAAHLGAPGSFVVTMGALNTACIVGSVAIARRRGGFWLMIATGIAIAIACRSIEANNFYDIWNPSAALFPLLLLAFLAWSLGCGEHRLLPLVVLVASYCAQAEDAFLAPALGLPAVGLAGLLLTRHQATPERPPASRGAVLRWSLAAVVVLAVCWTAPLVDQVSRGGNLGHVYEAARDRKASLGVTVGARAVVRTLGVRPWWLTDVKSPWARKSDVRHAPSTLTVVSACLLLAWLAVALCLGAWRRRLDVAVAAAVALVLCLSVGALGAATPTDPKLAATLGYTLWMASFAGMFSWLVAGWSAVVLAAPLVRSRPGSPTAAGGEQEPPGERPPARAAGIARVLAIAALALVAVSSAAQGRPDEHRHQFAAVKALNAGLAAVPAGHSVFLAARLDPIVTPLRPELTFALRRRGVRALGVGAYLRLGKWYERYAHPYDYVLWLLDRPGRRLPGGRTIARASVRLEGKTYRVTLLLAPAAAAPHASHPRATARGGASHAHAAMP